ncbi:uncharacterized protein [Malus domestica]|uniref:uncharacterized protein n=1 Tax=Malus domestica TaxID=3750 RepID=UPI0039771571
MALNFDCTSSFSSWWEVKWTKKYGGDLREAHDRLFQQLFIKSYPSSAQGNTKAVEVGLEEEAVCAFVFQEVAVEAERQGAEEGKDVSKVLRDSEGEVELVVETQATWRTRAMVVESSESGPEQRPRAQLSIPGLQATPTKKRTKAQTSKASKSSKSSTAPPIEMGRAKQKASTKVGAVAPLVGQSSTSIPSTSPPLMVALTSQFDPRTGEMLHFVEDNTTSVFGEPIVPEIPVVSEVTSPQASPQTTATIEELPLPIQDPAQIVEEKDLQIAALVSRLEPQDGENPDPEDDPLKKGVGEEEEPPVDKVDVKPKPDQTAALMGSLSI